MFYVCINANFKIQHQPLLQQDSHYILRDPEDDAKLAQVLVENVLKKTVEWPSEEKMYEYFPECMDKDSLEKFIEEVLEAAEGLDFLGIYKDHESDDDEPLPYFPGAEIFGEFEQVQTYIPVGDLDAEDVPTP